jgi:hypothetical protein
MAIPSQSKPVNAYGASPIAGQLGAKPSKQTSFAIARKAFAESHDESTGTLITGRIRVANHWQSDASPSNLTPIHASHLTNANHMHCPGTVCLQQKFGTPSPCRKAGTPLGNPAQRICQALGAYLGRVQDFVMKDKGASVHQYSP